MKTIVRWTEDQLLEEIEGIDARLSDGNGKVANSYLRQLLRDRKDALRLLKFRKSLGQTAFQAQAGM